MDNTHHTIAASRNVGAALSAPKHFIPDQLMRLVS